MKRRFNYTLTRPSHMCFVCEINKYPDHRSSRATWLTKPMRRIWKRDSAEEGWPQVEGIEVTNMWSNLIRERAKVTSKVLLEIWLIPVHFDRSEVRCFTFCLRERWRACSMSLSLFMLVFEDSRSHVASNSAEDGCSGSVTIGGRKIIFKISLFYILYSFYHSF
jgi:hypothetical protein